MRYGPKKKIKNASRTYWVRFGFDDKEKVGQVDNSLKKRIMMHEAVRKVGEMLWPHASRVYKKFGKEFDFLEDDQKQTLAFAHLYASLVGEKYFGEKISMKKLTNALKEEKFDNFEVLKILNFLNNKKLRNII